MQNTSKLDKNKNHLRAYKREGKAEVFPSWQRLHSKKGSVAKTGRIARGLLRFGEILPAYGKTTETTETTETEADDSPNADTFERFLDHFSCNIDFTKKRIIEIGAGPGKQTPLIAGLSPEMVVSVEPHPEFVQIAQKSSRNYRSVVSILRGVGEHLPLKSNSFHFAILHDIIEHVCDPLAVLKETYRILVPGGSALVAFVPWYSPYGGHTWVFLPVPWGHLFYSKKVLAEMRSSVAGWHTQDLNETGLYKVSLKDFHRMIERSGFELSSMRYMAIRNQKWLTRLPIIRELTTAIFAVQLVKSHN